MSNNIWGKSDLAGTDGSPGISGIGSIYTEGDLYISTTKDHNIYLNYAKANSSVPKGDVIINKNCTNANVQQVSGNYSITNGSLNASSTVTAGTNVVIGQDILAPCINTSTVSFDTGNISTFYSTDFASPSFVPTYFTWDNGRIQSTSLGIKSYTTKPTFFYDNANDSPYSVIVSVPPTTDSEVTVYMNCTAQTTFDFYENAPYAQAFSFNSYPLPTSTNGSTMYPNQWFSVTSADCLIYWSVEPGIYNIDPLVTSIQCMWIPGGVATQDPIFFSGQGYPNTLYTNNQSIGQFVYRFRVPQSTDTVSYKLQCGFNCTWQPNAGNDSALSTPYMTMLQTFIYNYNTTNVMYTLQIPSGQSPNNPTLGTTLVNSFNYKQLLPKYRTEWFEVNIYTTYPIVHNLNMSTIYPLNYTLFFSTGQGTYPMYNVTHSGTTYALISYVDANNITIQTLGWVGTNPGVQQYTTGYYCFCLF